MSDKPKDPTDAPPLTCCGDCKCKDEADAGPSSCTPDAPPPLTEEEVAQRKAWDEEAALAQDVTEQDKEHQEWYKEAGKVKTTADLVEFINHLLHDYNHDYGTICHATVAAAIAACWAVDRDPRQGGITGFQSSIILWEFISNWSHKYGPMRLLEYEYMLYPQHADQFAQEIPPSTWKYLQDEAQKKLDDSKKTGMDENGYPYGAAEEVVAHWQSIVDGEVPFGWTVRPESAVEAEEDEDT